MWASNHKYIDTLRKCAIHATNSWIRNGYNVLLCMLYSALSFSMLFSRQGEETSRVLSTPNAFFTSKHNWSWLAHCPNHFTETMKKKREKYHLKIIRKAFVAFISIYKKLSHHIIPIEWKSKKKNVSNEIRYCIDFDS